VRSVIPIALALACPVGMCLVPMMLMRRRGSDSSCHSSSSPDASEIQRLRAEVALLRAESVEREDAAR
jgi:hypothetical protein